MSMVVRLSLLLLVPVQAVAAGQQPASEDTTAANAAVVETLDFEDDEAVLEANCASIIKISWLRII